MKIIRHPLFWGVLLFLVFAAGGGWWFFMPSVDKTGDGDVLGQEQALDVELSKTRLYRLWREKYPADYQDFLKGIAPNATEASGEFIEPSDSLLPQSAVRLQRYFPYADDASLMRLTDFLTRQYAALQTISPLQCALYAVGDKEFDTRLLQLIATRDEKLSDAILFDILADVIASSDLKRKIPTEADIAPFREKMLSPESPEDRAQLLEAQKTRNQYEQICRMTLFSFGVVLKFPKEEAAQFMRYVFSTLSPATK